MPGTRSALVVLRALGKPAQLRQSACEFGAAGDRVHGAYRNGWRNAAAASAPGTPNTVWVAVRASSRTIWVSPVSRSQSRETVKPSLVRVLSSTNSVLGPFWRRFGAGRN